jgi:anti-sigma factor RsiW
MSAPVTESDLQAHVDGLLDAARASEVERHLAQHAGDAARVAAYREHRRLLREAYDPWLVAPLPPRLQPPRRETARWPRYAVAALLMLGSGLLGWHLHGGIGAGGAQPAQFARIAAVAHAVYSPEKRHPVEVGADQEQHLVNWLSKRLGASLKVPQLSAEGYALVGGRLLASERGPAAQFMYQDAGAQRLTLYVRVTDEAQSTTAFRYVQQDSVGVFYWVDGRMGYALSGEIERKELLRVAEAVYRQLDR